MIVQLAVVNNKEIKGCNIERNLISACCGMWIGMASVSDHCDLNEGNIL